MVYHKTPRPKWYWVSNQSLDAQKLIGTKTNAEANRSQNPRGVLMSPAITHLEIKLVGGQQNDLGGIQLAGVFKRFFFRVHK